MKFLDHLEEWLIASLMAIATLIIFIAVVHRYASGISPLRDYALAINMSWAQELCIYLFVWMAKFGAAYGVRTGVHVGVDVATNSISAPSRYWVVLFGLICGAIFTFTVGSFGAKLVYHMAHTSQTTNDLEAPQWLVYLAIPVGSYLMSFRFLQTIYAFARSGELPHTDESHVEGLERVSRPPEAPPSNGGAPALAGGAR